jgi:hypothetical protein
MAISWASPLVYNSARLKVARWGEQMVDSMDSVQAVWKEWYLDAM